jgi:uncharacterized protein (TIGR03086 family)
MSEISERYARVADQFTARVDAVPPDAWDRPSPCDGWVARDIVDHLVEWLSAHFFSTWGVPGTEALTHHDDPAAAWAWLDAGIRTGLADPSIAHVVVDNSPMGPQSYEVAIDTICTPDILIHTWDLARSVGLDETLDPDEVERYLANIAGHEDAMVQSGHYQSRLDVPDGADDQTRLLAILGRRV